MMIHQLIHTGFVIKLIHSGKLTSYISIHSDDKPYICDPYDQCFITRQNIFLLMQEISQI